jgi:branched-chain amino acid transport system substrate-binding protein
LGGTAALSGAQVSTGTPETRNFNAAADYVNQVLGGIAGHPLKLEIMNDQSDPAIAASLAEKLVSQKVTGIVFASYPPMTDQEMPVYERAGMVVISDSAPPPAQFLTYHRLFNVAPYSSDTYVTLPAFLQQSGIHSVGFLTDAIPTDQQLTQLTATRLQKANISVMSQQSVPFNATDMTTALREVHGANPDALVVNISTGMAHVYDGLRAINWMPKALIDSGVAWYDGLQSAGAFGPISYANCFYGIPLNTSQDPTLVNILNFFVAHTGGAFPQMIEGSLPALNALLTFKYAIEQTHSVDPATISSAIEGFQNKQYLTPANTLNFSASERNGYTKTDTCSLLPLGGPGQTAYIAASTTAREPIK